MISKDGLSGKCSAKQGSPCAALKALRRVDLWNQLQISKLQVPIGPAGRELIHEYMRAKIRVMIKRILRRYSYPPDKQEKATQTVLEQAEVLCREWVSV